MPYLNLTESGNNLRIKDETQLHYVLSTPSRPVFAQAAAAQGNLKELSCTTAPDPNYPILLVFPSELFSVSLLFPHILCDADLSKRFNILALDPRGHGLTREVPPRDDSPHLYDLDVKAADCMDFLTLFLKSAPAGPPGGWKVHAVACGMSGLVATRAAAKMASSILSCVIVSPILEVEDQFIIDSITECEELINEAWALAHDPDGEKNKKAKLPNEIVDGYGYRWMGEDEQLPSHVARGTFGDLFERFIRRPDGKEAAKAWLFNLYFNRGAQADDERAKVTADLLVVEGSNCLPYEEPIGRSFEGRFPNARSFRYEQINDAPFLLSVARPDRVRKIVKDFVIDQASKRQTAGAPSSDPAPSDEAHADKVVALSHAEVHQLRLAFTGIQTSQPLFARPYGGRRDA